MKISYICQNYWVQLRIKVNILWKGNIIPTCSSTLTLGQTATELQYLLKVDNTLDLDEALTVVKRNPLHDKLSWGSRSGGGSVGRAVVSDSIGPQFESSHWQLLLNQYILWSVCRKDENKEKEAGIGPFLHKKVEAFSAFFLPRTSYVGIERLERNKRFCSSTSSGPFFDPRKSRLVSKAWDKKWEKA